MRPHSVAAIAVLFFFLSSPNINKSYFYVEMLIKKGGKEAQKKEYDITIDKASPNYYKLRIGKMWTCEIEIIRYKPGADKFYIRHNHQSWITEDVDFYSNRIEGKYNGHRKYSGFESFSHPRPDNLGFRNDANNYTYEITAIR